MGTMVVGNAKEIAHQVRMLRECGKGRTVAAFMARENQERKAAQERQVTALRRMQDRNRFAESND